MIQQKLKQYSAAKIMAYDNHTIPRPTYIKTNDFTMPFQLIIDTYGVPSYQEANPAVITIVTFPFFFGMMFGDMGHGSILLMLGLVLTLAYDRLKGGPLNDVLPFRYLLLLLGFMSTYCGFIYNEYFALTTSIFPSCYNMTYRNQLNPTLLDNQYGEATSNEIDATYYYKRLDHTCNYPFGVDPAWALSKNRLIFANGIKMKLSVIMGIVHMSMGIIIKGTNAIYFKKIPVLIFEVCTGLIILLGLFGWMDLLIISKWFIPVDIDDPTLHTGLTLPFKTDSNDLTEANPLGQSEGDWRNQRMPSIIGIMITTAFGFGEIKDKDKENFPLIGGTQETQYGIALALLAIVMVMIPIMLFVIPCCFRGEGDHDEDHPEIEFTNINREQNDMQQNLIQRPSNEDESVSRNLTDDIMQKRQNQMKSLDA